MSTTHDVLSVPQAAIVLGVSETRVAKFCREGRIGQRVGGRWIIDHEELAEFAAIERPTGNPAFRAAAKKHKG